MSVTKTRSIPPSPAATRSERPSRRGILIAAVSVAILLTVATASWMATRFDPLGRVHADFKRGDYRASLGAAEDYLKRWPGNAWASLVAARCATRMGQRIRAETHYANAGSLDVPDLHDRAYGLVQMWQPQQAIDFYGRILAREPDNALALKRLAAVLMGLKRYSTIETVGQSMQIPGVPEIARRLMAIPGEEVAGRTLSAIACHVDRRYPEAAEDFLKVLELDPELKSMPLPATLFWNHLATDLLAQGQYAEARKYLMQGLAESQDAGLTELLGATYHQEGRDDEAERQWRLAVERDPNQPDAWLDLGQLAIVRRRPEEAVILLSRAAELAPDSVEAHQNLSVAYKQLDKPDQAEEFRKIAADLRAKSIRDSAAGEGPDRRPAFAASAAERQR